MCFSEFDARLVLPMRLVRAWLLVTALALGLTACTTTNRADSNAEGEWRRAEGGFHAKLIVTDQYEALTRDWDVRAEEGKYPDASSIDHVLKGQPVHIVLLFTNCLVGKDGICDMSVDFLVMKPDGTEYGSHNDRKLWRGKPLIKNLVYLGRPYLIFQADPHDPEGPYEVLATIRNSDSTLSVVHRRALSVTTEQ